MRSLRLVWYVAGGALRVRTRYASWMVGALVALGGHAAAAQTYLEPRVPTVDVAPFAGFFWSTSVNSSNGSVAFEPAADVGVALDFRWDAASKIEILYAFARPQARFESSSPFYASSPLFGVTTQYLQIGGLTTFQQGEVESFLSGGLGMAWFSPSGIQTAGSPSIQPADTLLFAFNLGLGLRWMFANAVGLRLEARAFMPVYFTSGTFLSGTNGAALQVSAGIPLVQGDLSIGIVIAP